MLSDADLFTLKRLLITIKKKGVLFEIVEHVIYFLVMESQYMQFTVKLI